MDLSIVKIINKALDGTLLSHREIVELLSAYRSGCITVPDELSVLLVR